MHMLNPSTDPNPAPLRSRYAWFLASSKPLLHSTEASLAQELTQAGCLSGRPCAMSESV
jgi:hypothetical protein